MNFNKFSFCYHATFKNLALTNGFGHIFVLASILLHVNDPLGWCYFNMCQLLNIFPMVFQCFHFNIAWRCFRQGKKTPTTRWHYDAFKSAHVQKVSLCVMYFAPSLGTIFGNFSGCSKYVTFSITFGPPVLQTTVCVMFFAPRRSFPLSFLGGPLAPSAARSGRDLRDATAPPGITSARSPRSVPSNRPNATTSTCRL